MKNIIILLTALVLLTTLALTGCSNQTTYTGNDVDLEKTFTYKDFTSVEISRTIEYHITQGNDYDVVASFPQNLSANLKISQTGQILKVTLKNGAYADAKFVIRITMPILTRLELSGTTVGEVTGFNSSNDFTLKMDGTNTCSLNGSVRHADMQIFGTNLVYAADFRTQTSDINMTGSSMATVNVIDTLNVNIKDLCTLKYIGNPKLGDIHIENSATIKQQ